jgi:hypothetical protein
MVTLLWLLNLLLFSFSEDFQVKLQKSILPKQLELFIVLFVGISCFSFFWLAFIFVVDGKQSGGGKNSGGNVSKMH